MGKAVRFFMKDVLKLMVDTDKAARLKVQKAVDKREALNESLTKIKDEIYSRYDEKAKSLIKKESENDKDKIVGIGEIITPRGLFANLVEVFRVLR